MATLRILRLCHFRHTLSVVRKADKPLLWLHGEIRTPPFSAAARVESGVLLRRLQRGEKLALPHSRPLPAIGRACHELRVQDATRTWRIVYFLDPLAIVILDVFCKATRKTPESIIRNCARRLRNYLSIITNKESK